MGAAVAYLAEGAATAGPLRRCTAVAGALRPLGTKPRLCPAPRRKTEAAKRRMAVLRLWFGMKDVCVERGGRPSREMAWASSPEGGGARNNYVVAFDGLLLQYPSSRVSMKS